MRSENVKIESSKLIGGCFLQLQNIGQGQRVDRITYSKFLAESLNSVEDGLLSFGKGLSEG